MLDDELLLEDEDDEEDEDVNDATVLELELTEDCEAAVDDEDDELLLLDDDPLEWLLRLELDDEDSAGV